MWLLSVTSAILYAVASVILVGVVPPCEAALVRDHLELPGATRLLIELSNGFCNGWLATVIWAVPANFAWLARTGRGFQLFHGNRLLRAKFFLAACAVALGLMCSFAVGAIIAPRLTIGQDVTQARHIAESRVTGPPIVRDLP